MVSCHFHARQLKGKDMRKGIFLALVAAIGCADQAVTTDTPTASTDGGAVVDSNAVELVMFTCPAMT